MITEPADMTVYKDYLQDLGILIKEMAFEAKSDANDDGTDFSIGYMAGFHRIVSLMQQQAEAFGIPLDNIGLNGIDADADLV